MYIFRFYPLTRQVVVVTSPVDGVNFSQLKGTLTGSIVCKRETDCASLPVTLRPLSPDGVYVGQPLRTMAIGKYLPTTWLAQLICVNLLLGKSLLFAGNLFHL